MPRTTSEASDAWALLVQFYFVQRSHLPPLGAELDPVAGAVPSAAP